MQIKNILPLALAGAAVAQQSNLTEVLASQNSSLSSLIQLLGTQPTLVQALSGAQNVTILAPNNEAIDALLKSPEGQAAATDPGLIAAILSYHVLNGTYYASAFTEKPQFIPTLLQNETFVNITGGQRVQAQTAEGGKVAFYSALRANSTVVQGNLNFTGGTIHIIDKVLSVPAGVATTLQQANLTAAVGAITKANVGPALASLPDLTYFIPNNAAFRAIGSLAADLNETVLQSILSYHVVNGSVLYSPQITNTSLTTLGGGNVTVRVIDETVFVNDAKVVVPNILVANGVAHVIDNVLNPANSTGQPEPSASTRPPAYTGASTATDGSNPFTSGVEAPSTTAPVATESNPANGGGGVQTTSSSTQAAAPMRTAAVGAAALFGGMAVYANM